ncbi:MAG: flagellar biosynthesis protein FlhF [bacterium]
MQIRKITAPTLKEAMDKMRDELGEDAIVLSTKVIEGDMKLGYKKMFELTAGVEEQKRNLKSTKPVPKQNPAAKNFDSELKKLTEKIYRSSTEMVVDDSNTEPGTGVVNKENKLLASLNNILLDKEIDKRSANMIVEQLSKYSGMINEKNIGSYIVSTISSMIPTSQFEIDKKKKPKIISLVGPTGVGKTTCIAKLAVISKLIHNLDVGLITIDTYRLGALDQLKIFAEISNIDFLVAYEPSDLTSIMSKYRKKDLIFIDTVGRSQNNAGLLKGIGEFLKPVKVDEIYLVLSATSTTRHMVDVAEKFKILNYDSIIFTKLDEAVAFGNMLNLITKTKRPIKYLTNGQVIPDDIIAADPEFIANAIYTGSLTK